MADVQYNPLSDGKRQRLSDAMQWSYKELAPYRNFHVKQVREYTGFHYGDNAENTRRPANMFKLAIDLYQRHLASGEPKVLVTTKNTELVTEAYELKLATDYTLDQIRFRATISEVIKSALFTLGIVRVGLTESHLDETASILHDAGQPYCDVVLFDDFVFDASKHRLEECDFLAHYYDLDYETVMESDEFNQKAKDELTPKDEGSHDDTFGEGDRTDRIGSSEDWKFNTYRRMVQLVDVWLPYDGLLVTMAKGAPSTVPPLRIMEWEGPERGPFHILSFSDVPGNIMPSSPGSQLIDLNTIINKALTKTAEQADNQKTVLAATGESVSSGEAQRIADGNDGEIVRVEDPDNLKDLRFGGADPRTLGFAVQMRQLFSYMGGNLDVLGGLAQQAATATQEQILKTSSGDLVAYLEDQTSAFTSDVCTDIAYLQYTNPVQTLNLTKAIENTDPPIEVPFNWTPDRRQNDFFSFQMQIDEYSLQSRTPGQRLSQIMQIIQQVIMPAAPLAAQQGISVDWVEVIKLIGRYTDLTELQTIIKRSGVPLESNPYSSGDPKAPTSTHRENVRINQPGQGTQAARDNVLTQALMTGSSQINSDQSNMLSNL